VKPLFQVLLLLVLPHLSSFGSTAFFVHHDRPLLARNYDWKSGHGFVVKNLQGQKKFAYGWAGVNPASWISKYGSITFNQFGKEFPIGGMNEAGLVVEQILLPHSIYPDHGGPTLSNSEWVQYQLDNFATVNELLRNVEYLQIYPLETVQFFVADKKGNAIVIDFVQGKIGIHEISQGHMVLTTESYLDADHFFDREQSLGERTISSNLDRYVHLKEKLKKIEVDEVYIAFGLLGQVASDKAPYMTQWAVVYDLELTKVHFKSKVDQEEKIIDFKTLDFSVEAQVQVVNISDNSVQWKPYNSDVIRFLFQKSQSIKTWQLDEDLLLSHLQDPSTKKIDHHFQEYHKNILFRFITKEPKGLLSFILIKKENVIPPKFESIKAGQFVVTDKEIRQMVYGIPKGKLSISCFQDTNFDGEFNNRLLSSPNNFQFLKQSYSSKNAPPKYMDMLVDITDNAEIVIRIK